jgi:hypothetical protein
MANNETRTGRFWSDARPLACGLAIIAGLLRFLPYLRLAPIFNFTPVGALGVFGGARLKWWQALCLPALLMIATDLILWLWKGNEIPWEGSLFFDPFVYTSFGVNILLGRLFLSRTESPWRIASITLLASVQFFLITNFGVWAVDCFSAAPMYTADGKGLLECYWKGLAFFQPNAPPQGFFVNTILSDLFFSSVLFAAHAVLTRTAFPAERVAPASDVVVSHA